MRSQSVGKPNPSSSAGASPSVRGQSAQLVAAGRTRVSAGQLLKPLVLTVVITGLDQLTKALVVDRVPLHGVGAEYLDGALRIIHTRNPAVAFSIGHGLPEPGLTLLSVVLPIVVLLGIAIYYVWDRNLVPFQRWMLAGVLGGGVGNLLDRFARPEGVVDFIDVAFYGILGLERWPTFNVADSAVVVCGIAFVAHVLWLERRLRRMAPSQTGEGEQ